MNNYFIIFNFGIILHEDKIINDMYIYIYIYAIKLDQ